MEFVLFWFGLSVLCGVFASNKGRAGFGYFVLAILISPLLCFILVAVLSNLNQDPGPSPDTHVKCPDCREFVLRDAKKCKHCGSALIPQ
jgi:hypothetical protein